MPKAFSHPSIHAPSREQWLHFRICHCCSKSEAAVGTPTRAAPRPLRAHFCSPERPVTSTAPNPTLMDSPSLLQPLQRLLPRCFLSVLPTNSPFAPTAPCTAPQSCPLPAWTPGRWERGRGCRWGAGPAGDCKEAEGQAGTAAFIRTALPCFSRQGRSG